MRRAVLSFAAALALATGIGASALAQDSGQMRGVFPPTQSWPASPGKAGAGKAARPTLEAPNYGAQDGGPAVTVPGTVTRGTVLPGDVHPAPIAGRPGYGSAVVNGRRVIVDMNSNRVFQSPD